MPPALAIWGASGHALVVADIIRQRGDYEIVAFLDDVDSFRAGTEFCGLPVLGGKEQLPTLKQRGVHHLIFAFGNCRARLTLADYAQAQGFALATAIHPSAIIASDASIGPGTVIAAAAVVNPRARIGANVIVNTSSSVDHESTLEDGVHICPGAHLAGKVMVGRAAWIGIGATVVDGVRIGADCLIGAGAVVLTDIPDGVVAHGVPARVVIGRQP